MQFPKKSCQAPAVVRPGAEQPSPCSTGRLNMSNDNWQSARVLLSKNAAEDGVYVLKLAPVVEGVRKLRR